jgi:hypothetical protein
MTKLNKANGVLKYKLYDISSVEVRRVVEEVPHMPCYHTE